jgi:Ran GTPase-activating protein (RanGAP) involved in mRNA processing and transport
LAALIRLSIATHGSDAGLAALAGAAHLAGLRWLSLRRNQIGLPGIEALAATPHLKRLRILDLGYNPLGASGIAALARAAWKDLRRLDVPGCGLGDEGAIVLAECSPWPLRSLCLASNGVTAEGVGALAGSALLFDLAYLGLSGNQIGDKGARALCESWSLSRQSKLDLADCGPFSPEVEEALRQRFGVGVRL